ncbi:MAG: transporter [Microvirga sp.]
MLIALCLLSSVCSGRAAAQEIMPYEFTALPTGTNLALGYYAYGHNTDYSIARGPTLRNSGLETHVGVIRYVHYDTIGDIRAGFQIYQGFGSVTDGHIGGQRLNASLGMQNVTLSAFLWPYHNEATKTDIILIGYINPPTGSYNRFVPLNLGDNRISGTLQVGFQQELTEQLGITTAYDAHLHGDNTDALPGFNRLSQDTTHRIQAWLNWRWNPALTTSIGYTGLWGGEQRLNGTINGTRTEIQRIRAHAAYALSPTLQVALELNHDVQATGGFRQEFGTVFRILQAF